MPFLEEDEWAQLAPSLSHMVEDIKLYRRENGVDLDSALKNAPLKAKNVFEEITGFTGVHPNAISHHRLSAWGPECIQCENLLRTPQASTCVYCGYKPD